MANILMGTNKLVQSSRLAKGFVSPRKKATRTFDLLFSGFTERPSVTLINDLVEWDYSDWRPHARANPSYEEGQRAGYLMKVGYLERWV